MPITWACISKGFELQWNTSGNVRLNKRPNFIIVVSLAPVNFNAIVPPARSKCTPMRSGTMLAL
eukprot:3568647-Ditylum_brightwellii.AAC.1